VVLFDNTTSDEHELSQDILTINTIFIYRRRAAIHRSEWKAKDNKNDKHTKQKKKGKLKTYPNHLQKTILKRWLGLMRYAYNTVVKWDKNHIKPQILDENLNYM